MIYGGSGSELAIGPAGVFVSFLGVDVFVFVSLHHLCRVGAQWFSSVDNERNNPYFSCPNYD